MPHSLLRTQRVGLEAEQPASLPPSPVQQGLLLTTTVVVMDLGVNFKCAFFQSAVKLRWVRGDVLENVVLYLLSTQAAMLEESLRPSSPHPDFSRQGIEILKVFSLMFPNK